jgi:hypothetical protein
MTQNSTVPTQAERDFVFHYYQEDCHHKNRGPAHQWTKEHGISNSSMIAFGYWEQRNNDSWLNQLLEDDAPPFQVPWSSSEEFFIRVREPLEVYPNVRYLATDQPRPHTFSGFLEGTTTDVRQD